MILSLSPSIWSARPFGLTFGESLPKNVPVRKNFISEEEVLTCRHEKLRSSYFLQNLGFIKTQANRKVRMIIKESKTNETHLS